MCFILEGFCIPSFYNTNLPQISAHPLGHNITHAPLSNKHPFQYFILVYQEETYNLHIIDEYDLEDELINIIDILQNVYGYNCV